MATIRPNILGASRMPIVSREEFERPFGVEPREGRKERKFAGKIFRSEIARLEDDDDADEKLQQPERRRQIAEDAGEKMLARRPVEALAAAARANAADCPDTSGGRESTDRSAKAGFPHRSRRASASCRPHIRRGGSAPPRRSHGSGYGRPRAAGRAGRAGRNDRAKASRADDRVMAPIIAVAAHPGVRPIAMTGP